MRYSRAVTDYFFAHTHMQKALGSDCTEYQIESAFLAV